MKYFLYLTLILLIACKPDAHRKLTVQQIVDKSILASGADKVSNSKISFKFRNNKYIATRNGGNYFLERVTKNDSVKTRDVLSNKGFKRYENSKEVIIPSSIASKYSGSVNSVHYFSVLPYGLNDAAVRKKLLKEVIIKNKEYYKVEVTFNKDGGGEDFEDVFIYWIGKQDFKVNFLAYSFNVDGGGVRFRELKEQCVKNGIRFVDYNNYKATDTSVKLTDLDKAFEKNQLKKVSEIILEDIKVEIN